jgi:hypothetical protein
MTLDQKIDLSTESDSVGQFMVQDINDAYIEVRFVVNQGLAVPQYEDVRQAYLESFDADTYFSSANALTEDGEIINVDGRCNRVAALLYGPKQVVYVIGANKIVPDIMSGFKRIKEIAAPKNCQRLSKNNYCAYKNECMAIGGESLSDGCKSESRICCSYIVQSYQLIKDRIKVIICNEDLGY